MALIIKGDMPIDCGCCDELVTMSLCPISLKEPLKYCNGTRHPDCPIIGEIPDEHGRLVDLDVLLHRIEHSVYPDSLDYTIAVSIMKRELKDAPVVVEATK